MRLQGREEHWQAATWRRRRCQPKAECWNVFCLSKLYDRERAESWNDWEEGGGWVMRAGLCESMQVAAGQRPPSLLGQLSEPGPMRRCLEVVARHHAAARAYKRHKCGWKCGAGTAACWSAVSACCARWPLSKHPWQVAQWEAPGSRVLRAHRSSVAEGPSCRGSPVRSRRDDSVPSSAARAAGQSPVRYASKPAQQVGRKRRPEMSSTDSAGWGGDAERNGL